MSVKDSEASVLGLRPLGLMNVTDLPQWGLGGGGCSLSGLAFVYGQKERGYNLARSTATSLKPVSKMTISPSATCFAVAFLVSTGSYVKLTQVAPMNNFLLLGQEKMNVPWSSSVDGRAPLHFCTTLVNQVMPPNIITTFTLCLTRAIRYIFIPVLTYTPPGQVH